MSLTGDFAKLASWIARLDAVASPQFMAANTREMSKATLDLIEEGFVKTSSPTGRKWQPKKRPNGHQTLVEKGHLRSRFSARVGRGSFEIRNPQPYARVHNYGSDIMPMRKMWPESGALPAKYSRAYTKIVTRRFFKIISGRGS
jgi:phage gpG-like protein